MSKTGDTSPDSTNDDHDARPPATPGEEHPTHERIAWVLVGMVALAVFVWPVLLPGAPIPSGTVAALLTALATILVTRKVS